MLSNFVLHHLTGGYLSVPLLKVSSKKVYPVGFSSDTLSHGLLDLEYDGHDIFNDVPFNKVVFACPTQFLFPDEVLKERIDHATS